MTLTLTQIARKTLKRCFEGKKFIPDDKVKSKYHKTCACFVTLTKNGMLMGCIGSLTPTQELWKNIQENAINAAFNDPRFSQLRKDELKRVKIEVSVLSQPRKLDYKNPDDLINKINNRMGIILKKGFYNSTFLPQVWEQIPDKIEFLQHLSMKAGLPADAWKQKDTEIWFYNVESENE